MHCTRSGIICVSLIIDSSFFCIPFGTGYHSFASLLADMSEMSEVLFKTV